MQFKFSKVAAAVAVAVSFSALSLHVHADHHAKQLDEKKPEHHFIRLSTFPVFLNTDIEEETVAEILDTSLDGNTVVYTDGKMEKLGFIDIRDRYYPKAAGTVDLPGEPTSVAVAGDYALTAVNTSLDFVNTSGELIVVDMESREIVAKHDLGGQPDSVAVSPDRRYAAIAIENERDEDLGEGEPPQAPAGFLVIIDLEGSPEEWTLRNVDLTGVADLFPEDPEPEYVSINEDNMAVVTLQENNHIVIVDLETGELSGSFNAGTVDLDGVDIEEERIIKMDGQLEDVAREPDGVTWIGNELFATANEGDLYGGSRGFSIFDKEGNVVFDAGTQMEALVTATGHYPDKRSENKGNEPENVAYGKIGRDHYLFVGSERSSVVAVYRLDEHRGPVFHQVLPTGVGPEGLKVVPNRGLLLVANEVDARSDKIRSSVSLYQRLPGEPQYPQIVSTAQEDGTPISWGALSGLATDHADGETLYSVSDSFYKSSSILKMNASKKPVVITDKIILKDDMGKLAAIHPELINDDGSVNIDQEGIATRKNGGFWIASEGAGSVDDESRPVTMLNMLLMVSAEGLIEEVVTLPESVNNRQRRFGFEGVAIMGEPDAEELFVAFQRSWVDDPKNHVRIGRYNVNTAEWSFYYYPLDTPESENGGWVGLSDIVYVGNGHFLVLERDNQGGPDAAIKRIYDVPVAGVYPKADVEEGTPDFPVLKKYLKRDLMRHLFLTGGANLEKLEGLAVLEDGTALVVNDNDGVDDSNGETQLISIYNLVKPH